MWDWLAERMDFIITPMRAIADMVKSFFDGFKMIGDFFTDLFSRL